MIVYQCQFCHAKAMAGEPEAEGWIEIRKLEEPYEESWHLCLKCQSNKEAVLSMVWEDPDPYGQQAKAAKA